MKGFLIQYSLFILTPCSLFFFPNQAKSQIKYELEAQAIGTTKGVVPFWMRSNQYGSIPMEGASSSFLGRAKRAYKLETDSLNKTELWDWGMGFEGRVNTNIHDSKVILTEAFLKGRLGPFELKIGRSKETMGLTGDTVLNTGSFSNSGNALGIPKIQLSIPQYYNLRLLDSMFAFKGTFSHGWLGQTRLHVPKWSHSLVPSVNSFYHDVSLYGRLHKKNWKLKLFAGLNHQVIYGNEKSIYGDHFKATPFQAYLHVITGKGLNTNYISKVGNHLGSIDLGLEYEFTKTRLFFYRQNFYESGALYYLANILDGLNGISIENKREKRTNVYIRKIVFEVLYTKNQAGELWSRYTPSGDENYYNHGTYSEGWSYKGLGLGFPFISSKTTTRRGMPTHETDFFNSNRVLALHLGTNFLVADWIITGKISYSQNFGTFGTTIGQSQEGRRAPAQGKFERVNQFSGYFLANTTFKSLQLGFGLAFDNGKLYQNSAGLILKATKAF